MKLEKLFFIFCFLFISFQSSSDCTTYENCAFLPCNDSISVTNTLIAYLGGSQFDSFKESMADAQSIIKQYNGVKYLFFFLFEDLKGIKIKGKEIRNITRERIKLQSKIRFFIKKFFSIQIYFFPQNIK